jgi:hypothetical protein
MSYAPDAIRAMLAGDSIAITGRVAIDNSFEIVAGVLKKYGGTETVVNIPPTVQMIDPFAFDGCKAMVSVEIPDSVERIGAGAFRGCERLQEIIIPASVKEIGASLKDAIGGFSKNAVSKAGEAESLFGALFKLGTEAVSQAKTVVTGTFQGCSSLQSVTLSSSLSQIPMNTFMNCASLGAIEIPDSIVSIGVNAFNGCTSLQTVEFPDSVTSIESFAFCGCTSLRSVSFSASLAQIGLKAFSNCPSLRAVALPSDVVQFMSGAFDEGVSVTTMPKNGVPPSLPPTAGGTVESPRMNNAPVLPSRVYQCSVCGAKLAPFQESCSSCKTKFSWN